MTDRRRVPVETGEFRTKISASICYDDFYRMALSDPTVVRSYASSSITDALVDAALPRNTDMSSVGFVLGTTVGGALAFIEHTAARRNGTSDDGGLFGVVGPSSHGAIAGRIASDFRFGGPVCAISTACSAGANAIGRAYDTIRLGRAKRMVAGGCDLFTPIAYSGFGSLQALARDACRPFDNDREGLTLGDASAFMVLEPYGDAVKRRQPIYAIIGGYAIANEAYHATGPDPTGAGAIRVMTGALRASGMSPDQIDYVNAHGTGTKANDAMEAIALRQVFGGRSGSPAAISLDHSWV